jgi:hypothetical protein
MQRWLLEDLGEPFDGSRDDDEHGAKPIHGGLARGHLLLASKRVGLGKHHGHREMPVSYRLPGANLSRSS